MPVVSIEDLLIPGVKLVRYRIFEDNRGFFAELYKRTEYLTKEIPYDFVQVNLSYSKPRVVRGLHYQLKPYEQGKLVYVVRGKVYDVAVDIRKKSPWFGKYAAAYLEPGTALWIPPGFAHGFQAIEDTLMVYLVTKEYAPDHERCIAWNDEEIGIDWPIKEDVILSRKDSACPPLKKAETNFNYSARSLFKS